jgi:CheY-like chemotaxis protein
MSQQQDKVVVLVADDEPSTLALVAAHVRSRGHTVYEASDGDLAWQLAHEHLPDLVVLDVMMPGMSGWEVCRKIREAVSLAHTGVIMLTGIGENLNEMTSPLYGADAYLDKPFEFSELDARIAEVLERRRSGTMGRPETETRRSSAPPVMNGSNGTAVQAPLAKAAAKKPKATPAKKEPAKAGAAKQVAKAPAKASAPKTARKAVTKPQKKVAAPAPKPVAKAKAGGKTPPKKAAKSVPKKAPAKAGGKAKAPVKVTASAKKASAPKAAAKKTVAKKPATPAKAKPKAKAVAAKKTPRAASPGAPVAKATAAKAAKAPKAAKKQTPTPSASDAT